MAATVTIAPLDAAHAAAATGLTTAVGWTHRQEDWLFALSVGRGLGAFDSDGALRATLVWFPYGSAHGSIGMIAVDPSLQRSGIGRMLMQRLQAEASGRTLLLVSTQAGRRLYETLGFHAIGSNAAHIGTSITVEPVHGVTAARTADLDVITNLDAEALGYERRQLIAALADAGDVAIVPDDKGRPTGFAICRRFGRGHVVGPVVAGSSDHACRLVGYWLARRTGQIVRIDVPAEHTALAEWLTDRGLARGGESPIMVRGDDAPAPGARVHRYALVSQAMG
ncbi:GNAT family N-acetyltransferase [Reyranella sp. CPCC 100927]|uniref:GNAT family N-acetyltransferase n=1 Tax=Reyranella sp. CPCC 100927 TaxID=2599616 RepID=UPI0011B6837E|nr:GNAT family N-acetyltransferase [Reyranella sp. CPCC 100927]TWT13979.1 GNAT family N-acetyltransferase [Reyranella sp. CPCC 100927]